LTGLTARFGEVLLSGDALVDLGKDGNEAFTLNVGVEPND